MRPPRALGITVGFKERDGAKIEDPKKVAVGPRTGPVIADDEIISEHLMYLLGQPFINYVAPRVSYRKLLHSELVDRPSPIKDMVFIAASAPVAMQYSVSVIANFSRAYPRFLFFTNCSTIFLISPKYSPVSSFPPLVGLKCVARTRSWTVIGEWHPACLGCSLRFGLRFGLERKHLY